MIVRLLGGMEEQLRMKESMWIGECFYRVCEDILSVGGYCR